MTGTETRGDLVGGESVLSMCSIVQQFAAVGKPVFMARKGASWAQRLRHAGSV